MSEMDFEDAELISGFREESLEHIEVVETKMLELESSGVNASDVNEIFRSIHTIKGGSGFLGFEAIKELSHYMESLLDLIRNGKRELTSDAADILLRGTDLLKAMLEDLANQDQVPYANEIVQLDLLIKGESADAPAKPVAPKPGGQVA
jgi:two-component system chemotaxis sensor kinase CheA